ncbi:uncharacterized protein LOC126323890 [Schistocerca gregaria]|uniref:uncharacterized protein LOC126323890 n=1 Tax=Schistocerca gregaria TaxID=7010 RepID=UPI00211E4612|nr:uncharacterized protein LOC126323890 [Schistocerca gregaria]
MITDIYPKIMISLITVLVHNKMKGNYTIAIFIISLALSGFAIADETLFVNDLKRVFREALSNTDFFPDDYCDSKFFTCNDEKKIITIKFKDINLDGIHIPHSISTLTDLVSLYISNSTIIIDEHFMGDLYKLRNSLKRLEITNTKFETNLRLDGLNLIYLNLSCNNISQNLDNISFSKTLTHIDLSDNKFHGDIKIFNDIPDLEVLYVVNKKVRLSFNNLTGNIPSFSNNINLAYLDLASNILSGIIPDFSNNYNLKELDLAINRLSGIIPDFSNNYNLKELYLSFNNLTGNIPDFSNNINLAYLDLASNILSGIIPDFSNNYNLKELYLSFNNLTGNIPSFSNNINLTHLDLSKNNLSGTIPDFSKNYNLMGLYLSSNNLTGNIPDFSNNINLTHLYLSDNKLSGNIPDFSRNHALTKLNISYNKLSGNLPSFINNRALYLLHLSKNYDFTYNCPGGKDIISPEQITNLISWYTQ